MSTPIFYSWQSDLPNRTNRSLIQDALEIAIKELGGDEALPLEVAVDRDTSGLPGSPHIAEAILQKIEKAAVFVADISLVGKISIKGDDGVVKKRTTPNPNVCIELGYALRALGPDRIILVLNDDYGAPELLPFDLRHRRVLRYTSCAADKERAGSRKALARDLVGALKPILTYIQEQEGRTQSSSPRLSLRVENAIAEIGKSKRSGDDAIVILQWEVYLENLGGASAHDVSLVVEHDRKDSTRDGCGTVPTGMGKWPASQRALANVPEGRIGFHQSYFVNQSFQPRMRELALRCHLRLYRLPVSDKRPINSWSLDIKCSAQVGVPPVALNFSFSEESLKDIYMAAWAERGLEEALQGVIAEKWLVRDSG